VSSPRARRDGEARPLLDDQRLRRGSEQESSDPCQSPRYAASWSTDRALVNLGLDGPQAAGGQDLGDTGRHAGRLGHRAAPDSKDDVVMSSRRQQVLVAGATGRVGRLVVAGLLAAGARVTALVRSPAAASLPGPVVLAEGDLRRPESVRAAARDVDTAFLLWPSFDPSGAAEAVDALTGQVGRVVYLSAAALQEPGGRVMPGVWADVEELLAASGAECTFLRAGGFAANTLQWAGQIRAGDVVRIPFPAARRSLVHESDLADAAVTTICRPGHAGQAYVLTGPESLTQAEQVDAIGAAIGRRLRVVEQNRADAAQELRAAGFAEGAAQRMVNHWASLVQRPERVSDDLARLTGRPALRFATWASDHAADFSPMSSSAGFSSGT
jgi:uncharacterized protein YbjT (DUF2867 family)